MEKIWDVIKRLVMTDFGIHPYDINCGSCDDFATQVCELIPGAEVFDLPDRYAHTVIKYNDRYYDAEEPYGVKEWKMLPLCIRARRRG